MRIAYFDCFAGAGGDMIVGALLDAGCDFDALKAELQKLPMKGVTVKAERVQRLGLAGVRFSVEVAEASQGERHLSDILEMVESAPLPQPVTDQARRIFTRLAEAEAKAHNTDVQAVHFHEVGAADSIVDIVGACSALHLLGVERVVCSPIPLGSGSVSASHGTLPVPAPATAALLVGARTAQTQLEGELTTPTAAAVLTTLAESYAPLPAMDVEAVGYGAGTRQGEVMPNLLRVYIGTESPEGQADSLIELSANVDDCTGAVIGATIEKLLAAGCMDAWAMPIVMKKSRPAWTLSALAAAADLDEAERIIFSETTTFGIRRRIVARSKLTRHFETIETPYGPIRMKVGRRGGETMSCSPEFADCLSAAEAHHVPVKEVMGAAMAAFRREHK